MEKKKLGIFPGSFDEMHVGHFDVLEQSEKLFGNGNVILALGCNPDKVNGDIEVYKQRQEQRAKVLSKTIGRQVMPYFMFLDEFILQKEKEGYDVFLIRGLRNGQDLAYEDNQIRFIEDFLNFLEVEYKLKTIFFRCSPNFDHVSSSAIRAIDKFSDMFGRDKKRSEKYKIIKQ
jgi:cytidyltransferase-like protein